MENIEIKKEDNEFFITSMEVVSHVYNDIIEVKTADDRRYLFPLEMSNYIYSLMVEEDIEKEKELILQARVIQLLDYSFVKERIK